MKPHNPNRFRTIISLICCTVAFGLLQAQPTLVPTDTTLRDKDRVYIEHADVGELSQQDDQVIRKLSKELRQVELRQEDIYMYTDTALLINDTSVVARGNVLIQQGDSLSAFADSLLYESHLRKADLFGEVVLMNKAQKLFTDKLHYDFKTKIATYRNGATLTNDTSYLRSLTGYYHVDTDLAYFKDSVVVSDSNFTLFTDTLRFDTRRQIATFLGPTLIEQDSAKIYCEGGYYDMRKKQALFTDNAQYVKGTHQAIAKKISYDGNAKTILLIGNASSRDSSKLALADTIRYETETEITYLAGRAHFQDEQQVIDSERIRYNRKTEAFFTSGRARIVDPPQILEADEIDFDGTAGLASGNVVWQDTTEEVTLISQFADYHKEEDYIKASGDRPLLITVFDGDSLFLRADTLVGYKDQPQDSTRKFTAYDSVKIYKSDLQGVCDSLMYSTQDSLFEFFDDPVLWSDTTQFSADTIRMKLVNNEIDQINMFNKAFINNTTDEVLFNQIKGKTVTAFFREKELRRMKVKGNAESVYYAQDEANAYVAVNKTACSSMMIYFGNNKVDDILFYAQPKGNIIPIRQANHEQLKLEGFRWESARRPLSEQSL